MATAYLAAPPMDFSSPSTDPRDALPRYMMRIFVPLWAAAGLSDWYWHKRTDIEHTAGLPESLLHIVMFGEAGVPLLLALFCEVNAGSFAASIASIIVHELTAFVDVRYAANHRKIPQWEDHTHSFLEVLPFTALSMTAIIHWGEFRSLLAAGHERPDFRFRPKRRRLPMRHIAELAAILAFGVALPYANELYRCWRARRS